MPVVPVEELQRVVRSAIARQGYSLEEAALIEKVILFAQLRGNNQGISKLVGEGMPKSPRARTPVVVTDRGSSALIDGNQSHGMVVLNRAAELSVEKALQNGVGIVGTRNTSSSSGCLAYYCQKVTESGLCCLVVATSPAIVAPFGSNEGVFGTNPVAFGAPRGAQGSPPLLVDFATSAMAFYGLVEASVSASSVASDVGFDSSGQVTTDPDKILDGGALRTFDRGAKGSALGLMVSILGGALVGASTAYDPNQDDDWGHLVISIDPSRFENGEGEFRRRLDKLLARVESARAVDPLKPVRVPGAAAQNQADKSLLSGGVFIEDGLWRELGVAASGTPAKAKL